MRKIGVPEDRDLSPITGWTRRHWETVVDDLLASTRPYASPQHALVDLPGPSSSFGRWSDGLEGFARTFVAAAFRMVHADELTRSKLARWYRSGLVAGTDPQSPERWPRLDEIRQAKVEAGSIALALHETRRWIWDTLDDGERRRVIDWLSAYVGEPVLRNNHAWFQGVVEAFLRSVGGPWSPADLDHIIELTDEWALPSGWYTDGNHRTGEARNFDHYSGWAMQVFPLWFCRISGPAAPPGLLDRYRDRLRGYLDEAQDLVGGDGAPLYQGRSLTYRFAAATPFWSGAIFDATALPPGRTRRIASGMLKYFFDQGCTDHNGLLTLGWHGAFPAIKQNYSGPGSPYWASKGLAGLVLPADHPVWTATEEPLEIDLRDVERTLIAPGWVVSGTTVDGIVRIANHGSDRADPVLFWVDDPVYGRDAYSTRAGPEHGPGSETGPADSHTALLLPDGRPSHRRPFERLSITGRVAISRHQAHWLDGPVPGRYSPQDGVYVLGPWMTTASVLHGPHEIRMVRVDPAAKADQSWPQERGPWPLRISGYSLAGPQAPESTVDVGAARARRGDGVTSSVAGMRGSFVPDCRTARGYNAFGTWSVTPYLTTGDPVVVGEIYAVGVTLAGPGGLTPLPRLDVEGDAHGAVILVTWDGGESDEFRLDPPEV